jgi:hypothetical protein
LPTADAVAGLLALDAIFPPPLAQDARFRAMLIGALGALREKGARAVLEESFG